MMIGRAATPDAPKERASKKGIIIIRNLNRRKIYPARGMKERKKKLLAQRERIKGEKRKRPGGSVQMVAKEKSRVRGLIYDIVSQQYGNA